MAENYDFNNPEFVSVIDELPLWSAPFGLKLLEMVNLKHDIKVLDIGCGTGFPLFELAFRLGETCSIYGLDPWKGAEERIKQKRTVNKANNVTVINAVAEKIPFTDNFFDLIVSNNGFNNVEDLELSVKESYRVAKKNAQLVYAFNLPETMIEFYNCMETSLVEHELVPVIDDVRKHIHKKRLPLDETTALFMKAGFSVNNIRTDEFTLRFVDAETFFNHFLIRIAFLDSWKTLIEPTMQRKVFSSITRRINMIALEKGCFTVTIPFAVIDFRKCN